MHRCIQLSLVLTISFLESALCQTQFTGYGTGVGSGRYNTLLGYYAGNKFKSTSSYYSTAIGSFAAGNATGTYSVFVGRSAGNYSKGSNNTFVGYSAASSVAATGSHNIAIGSSSASKISTGSYNSFVGSNIGSFSGAGISGAYNVINGYRAAFYLNSGQRNTIIGANAGYRTGSGSDNIFIGYQAGYNWLSSNKLFIENSSSNVPLIGGDFSTNQVSINAGFNNLNGYTLTVGGAIRSTSGNLSLGASATIDDDTSIGGINDDWLKLNGYIEMRSNTDNYGIVLRNKDASDYLGITQKDGYSYLTDNSTYNNYFIRGNGADVSVRGHLNAGGNITAPNLKLSDWNTAYTQRGSNIAGTNLTWDAGKLNVSSGFTTNVTAPNLNISNWNESFAWGNHADQGYLQAGGSSQVNVLDANHYDVNPGNGKGIRFWNEDSYKIHMGNTSEYRYGPVTDYSIKTNMNNVASRGWTWGVSGGTPVAAINTEGKMQIKSNLTTEGHLYGRSVHNQVSNIYRFGGVYFTWDSDSYGSNTHHSIRSTYGDSYGDHLTMNSFGNIRFNFDSNENGDNVFEIGKGTTGTGNILFHLNEAGKLGLGESSPMAKLHINHSSTMGRKFNAAQSHLTITDGTQTTLIDPNEIYNNDTMHFGSANGFKFSKITPSGSTDWAAINADGKLTVYGDIESSGSIKANTMEFDLTGLQDKGSAAERLLVAGDDGVMGYRSALDLENPWIIEIIEENGVDLNCLAFGGTVEVDIFDAQGNLMLGNNATLDDDGTIGSPDIGDDWIRFSDYIEMGSAHPTKGLVLYGPGSSSSSSYLNVSYDNGSSYFTNDFGFTDGVDRYFMKATGRQVDFAGNVGIGLTDNPTATLDIGTGSIRIRSLTDAAGAEEKIIVTDNDGVLYKTSFSSLTNWQKNNEDILYNGGNVGINVVGTPSEGLDIGTGTIRIQNLREGSEHPNLVVADGTGRLFQRTVSSLLTGSVSDANRVVVLNSNDELAYQQVADLNVRPSPWSENIDQIKYEGSVGIDLGNDAATQSLDVGGGARIRSLIENPLSDNLLVADGEGTLYRRQISSFSPWKKHTNNSYYSLQQVGLGAPNNTIDIASMVATDMRIGLNVKTTDDSGESVYAIRSEVPTDDEKAFAAVNSSTGADVFRVFGDGIVEAKEVLVSLDIWNDHVFYPTYDLMPLEKVEKYVQKHHHLPEIPSEKEVLSEGVKLGEMESLLLKKVEELTLYLIDQDKQLKEQATLLRKQADQIEKLQAKLD